MRLAAIYNVFDGVELLKGSIESIRPFVDEVIIVYQDVSNYGERFDPLPWINQCDADILLKHDPHGRPLSNEIAKRNKGIKAAFHLGCTHFLTMDCDEYYRDFGAAKQAYIDSKCSGSVVPLHTYFKEPTLMLEKDEDFFVPFIHKLNRNTVSGGRLYPYRVDPSRRINDQSVIKLPHFMHHYSWVRADIDRKVRNSTAAKNLAKSKHLTEYRKDLKEGDFLECYNSKLVRVPNWFNIPNFGKLGAMPGTNPTSMVNGRQQKEEIESLKG